MPRPKRIHYEGAVYHVTSRGNERRKIVVDDQDRWEFIRVLAEAIEEEDVVCHAWVLMDNHYHLMLETPHANLSRAMWHLNGIYTQKFNRKHHRTGHLFQGRFKAIVVEKDVYLKELSRYVVLNPVRAKMVKTPGDWKWSSYRATAGLEKREKWLETGWLLGQFGKTEKQAYRGYREFVAQGVGLQESPWEELYSRVYLGKEKFLRKVHEVGKRHRNLDVPKYQKEVLRQVPEKLLGRIGEVFGEKPEEILRAGRRRSKARLAAVYLLKRESGLTLKELGKRMGVGFSAVGMQWTKAKKLMAEDEGFARLVLRC